MSDTEHQKVNETSEFSDSEWPVHESDFRSTPPIVAERPELTSDEAQKRVKESLSRTYPLPQVIRLRDGKLVDSYDWLKKRGVEIVGARVEVERGFEWGERWYETNPGDKLRILQGDIAGGFESEDNGQYLGEIMGLRTDLFNKDPGNIAQTSRNPDLFRQPYIRLSREEEAKLKGE